MLSANNDSRRRIKGKEMDNLPPNIAELLLTGFRAFVSEADPTFLGLVLERPTGEALPHD